LFFAIIAKTKLSTKGVPFVDYYPMISLALFPVKSYQKKRRNAKFLVKRDVCVCIIRRIFRSSKGTPLVETPNLSSCPRYRIAWRQLLEYNVPKCRRS